jgi:putative flippase GtrA
MLAGRALVVGGALALLSNVPMIAGDWIGLHYAVTSAPTFVIMVLIGYWAHSTWTFKGAERSGAAFGRYVLVALANLPLSLAGLFVFVDLIGLPVPIASPIVTVLMFVANLLGNRWALRAGRASPGATPGRSADRRPGARPDSGAG